MLLDMFTLTLKSLLEPANNFISTLFCWLVTQLAIYVYGVSAACTAPVQLPSFASIGVRGTLVANQSKVCGPRGGKSGI